MTSEPQTCPDFMSALSTLRALHTDIGRHLATREAEHGVLIDIQTVRCDLARTQCLLVQLEAAINSAHTGTKNGPGTEPTTPAAETVRSVATLGWQLYHQLVFLGGARYFEHGTAADDAWAALTTLRQKVAAA